MVIDKSGANLAGLENMNCLLIMNGWFWLIDILQVKYLNNTIKQDHRFIKKLTKQMKGFKAFMSASATLDGIEVAHMISWLVIFLVMNFLPALYLIRAQFSGVTFGKKYMNGFFLVPI